MTTAEEFLITKGWSRDQPICGGLRFQAIEQLLTQFAALKVACVIAERMPSEEEIRKSAYHYCMRPSMPDGEPEPDEGIYMAYCDGIKMYRSCMRGESK